MKLNRKALSLLLVSFLICVAIIGFVFMAPGQTPVNFKCSGNYNTIGENKSLSSIIRITFTDKQGAAVMHGVIKDKEGNASDLTLSVLFNTQIINKSFALTSTGISVRQTNRSGSVPSLGYEELLPGIFSKNGDIAIYTIYPQGVNKYLFVRGKIPVFFCDGNE